MGRGPGPVFPVPRRAACQPPGDSALRRGGGGRRPTRARLAASSPASGRNELTSAGLGTRQRRAAPGLRLVSAARAPGPEGGGRARGPGGARHWSPLPPPGGVPRRAGGRGRAPKTRPPGRCAKSPPGRSPGRAQMATLRPIGLTSFHPAAPPKLLITLPPVLPIAARQRFLSSILAAGCKLLLILWTFNLKTLVFSLLKRQSRGTSH